MPLSANTHVPSDIKTTVIEITSYEHKNLQGIIKNPYLRQDISFHSAVEFLLAVDEMLDSLDYPQAAMASRSFRAKPVKVNLEKFNQQINPLAVFKLNVVFRQNASWQGTLTWVNEARQLSFRSVFEMLKLIDSVISSGEQENIQAGSR